APTAAGGARAAGPPPEALVRWLASHTRHGSVRPVATVCTRRSGVLSAVSDSRVAVVLDWVEIISGPDDVPAFGVVEVELVEGDSSALDAAVDALRRAGAEPANGTPEEALWRRIAPRRGDGGLGADPRVRIR